MGYKVYKVKITEEDIKNGMRLCPHACPIAIAIKRLSPEFVNVQVLANRIRINSQQTVFTNQIIEDFIADFDYGKKYYLLSLNLD